MTNQSKRRSIQLTVFMLSTLVGARAQAQMSIPTSCDHPLAKSWLAQRQWLDAEGYPVASDLIACQQFSQFNHELIIARLSPAANSAEQDPPFNLYLYRLNQDGELVTQVDFPHFTFNDATGPQQLRFEPNSYRLAPQANAIGLRIRYHNQGCRVCEGDWQKSELHLFLVRAKTFNWIVRRLNVAETSTQQAANSANCVYAGSQLQVRLKLAKTRHAGLADLLLYVQQSTVPGLQNYGGPACPASKLPTTHQLLRWHYNGQQYQGPQPTLLGR